MRRCVVPCLQITQKDLVLAHYKQCLRGVCCWSRVSIHVSSKITGLNALQKSKASCRKSSDSLKLPVQPDMVGKYKENIETELPMVIPVQQRLQSLSILYSFLREFLQSFATPSCSLLKCGLSGSSPLCLVKRFLKLKSQGVHHAKCLNCRSEASVQKCTKCRRLLMK